MQLYRPPPLPPISELARPELKLAGMLCLPSTCVLFRQVLAARESSCPPNGLLMPPLLLAGLRIDAELFGSSRMGYSTGEMLHHLTLSVPYISHLLTPQVSMFVHARGQPLLTTFQG